MRLLSLVALFLLTIVGHAEAAVNFSAMALLSALIQLIIIGFIFWLLWWLIGYINLPEPFNKIARAVIAIVAVIFLINFLLGLSGSPMFTVGR